MKKGLNILVVVCMMMCFMSITKHDIHANDDCEHVWENYYTTDEMSTDSTFGQKSVHCQKCDAIDESRIKNIPIGSTHINAIVLDYPEVNMRVGTHVDNYARTSPRYAADDDHVQWFSENPEIAIVEQSGLIHAVAPGTATLTVTSTNGVVVRCPVHVYESKYDQIDEIERIYGDDRYETAFEVAEVYLKDQFLRGYPNLIIASGTNYADALAGSYLSAKKNAPILMANNNKDMDVAMHYHKWQSLNCKPYILGGTSAVRKIFETHFKSYEMSAIRLAGKNRYETNLEILKEAGIDDEPILVATGNGFADSLSASAVGYPILLVNQTLSAKQKEFLKQLNGNPMIIIGGTSAVSTNVENQLRKYGEVERLAGVNRYETSVLVAERFFEHPDYAVLAYAKNFPDGLSGGPLAYLHKGPLLLTDNDNWQYAADFVQEKGIVRGAVLGGPTLISSETVKNIFNSEPNTMTVYSNEENGITTDLYIVQSDDLVISINEVRTMNYDHKDVPTDYDLRRKYDRLNAVYAVKFRYDYIYNRYGSYYKETTFIDYSKADFEELVKNKLMAKDDDVVPTHIVYSEFVKNLEDEGYTKKVIY
ncbi:MAG: cell wall-binding repeat-containing protein [Erysipelotrichaceae bacterium]|nr:cell wall-binding repeat-containing protein [Erysipelotrichaceae bacterium]